MTLGVFLLFLGIWARRTRAQSLSQTRTTSTTTIVSTCGSVRTVCTTAISSSTPVTMSSQLGMQGAVMPTSRKTSAVWQIPLHGPTKLQMFLAFSLLFGLVSGQPAAHTANPPKSLFRANLSLNSHLCGPRVTLGAELLHRSAGHLHRLKASC